MEPMLHIPDPFASFLSTSAALLESDPTQIPPHHNRVICVSPSLSTSPNPIVFFRIGPNHPPSFSFSLN
ncbi:hypothetical protein P8452_75436 [Trifolium repens]|nr:hypothetical protein P8452_75436 [Trifolium repens]